MIIDIPMSTPMNRRVDTIGIWMSGGADSSLLCYLLAEHIKKEKLDIKIQPLTIDYKRPFKFIAGDVIDEVKKLLDAEDMFLKPLVYNPPDGLDWTAEELATQFHLQNKENIIENRFQVLFSGITTNPPKEVQTTFSWGVLADVEIKRGDNVVKETTRHFYRDGYEFFEIKPFFNLNKKDIAKFYKEKNLINTLFPLTRSCEKVGTVAGHCGKCWWCEERHWAFGKLE